MRGKSWVLYVNMLMRERERERERERKEIEREGKRERDVHTLCIFTFSIECTILRSCYLIITLGTNDSSGKTCNCALSRQSLRCSPLGSKMNWFACAFDSYVYACVYDNYEDGLK